MRASPAKPEVRSIEQAQLVELSRRSRVSIAFSIPALITVAAVHSGQFPAVRIILWLTGMLLIQTIRFTMARRVASATEAQLNPRPWITLEILCSAIAGTGWGAWFFVLDSGALDFLFLFKFIAVAAAMGVAMNAFSAVLLVYGAFIVSTALTMVVYLLTQAHFLNLTEKISLLLGIATYTLVLFNVSKQANRLERYALVQRIERGKHHCRLRQKHKREVLLRQKLEMETAQLAELNRKLDELARNDPLTALFNRRHLEEQLEHELMMAQRHRTVFSTILIDIDNFKNINDRYSHQAGDRVLIRISAIFSAELREIDALARWGGEEFFVLLPNAATEEAAICAERLREILANRRLLPEVPELHVTASFGVASYRPGDDADSLIKRADDALYTAKSSGKNRVYCAPAGSATLFPEAVVE